MDLNHIFLFVAVVSSLLVLARAWRSAGVVRGWRLSASIVLAVTAVAWFVKRSMAGYVGGGAWFILLFLPTLGLRRISQLAGQGNYRSARRLSEWVQWLHPTAQMREQVAVLRTLEARHAAAPQFQNEGLAPQSRGVRDAPAVFLFVLLNVIVFFVELWRGALANPNILHRLGSLDFAAVVGRGEFWRLLTALFLHYNLLHLAFNLFALYVLGPPLEKTIGSLRFAVAYLVSGIGSTAGVVALTVLKIVQPAELVGASGSVMGIVGAWAGFLVRHRHAWQAKQRLLNILMIIVIQIAFDVSTPQVSTSAHLCGLVTGFVVGLYLSPKRART